MTDFKPGDKVRVRKPSANGDPWWVAAYMDQYHDTVQVVHHCPGYVRLVGIPAVFNKNWLTLVPDTPAVPKIDFTKPVQTRDRRAVRILCTDRATDRPVVGLVGNEVVAWRKDGSYYETGECLLDLVQAPPPKAEKTVTVLLRKRVGGCADGMVKACLTGLPGFLPPKDTVTWKVIARKTITLTEGEGME